ncbi:MAG: (d)CMP kinase [Alcaligenaceae bacterium]|jgi:cytidylate kinase|nr:(d)CMP kinase [Alcaligenaceae bacterium]
MDTHSNIPVITIDGPSASGKGTVATLLARELGWYALDSGALYRLTALDCMKKKVDLESEEQVSAVASGLSVKFLPEGIFLHGEDVTESIESEQVGAIASKIAVYPQLRATLLQSQRNCRRAPGLVADGRDMGTMVFPDADLKIYLVADVRKRAERRYKQLMGKGFSVKLNSLVADLGARDQRDMEREFAPLKPADDAIIVDSSDLDIEETLAIVLEHWASRCN